MPYSGQGDIYKSLVLVGQLGLIMVICILGGFLGGWALDNYLNTGFVFAVLFLLIGLGGGMIACYRAVMSAIGEDDGRRKPRF